MTDGGRPPATSARKRLERLGRHLLVRLAGVLFGVRRRRVELAHAPRILVVRLDERVGNMLLLVPLLDSLRQRFSGARVDLLASVKGQMLMQGHPALDGLLTFRKRALLAADGPLRVPSRLRRRRYDLAIDAANPTDPSATQAILVRLSGARHTVGVDFPGFGRMFSAPVAVPDHDAHEIDLRLELLAPLPGEAVSRRVYLGALPAPAPESATAALLARLAATSFVVVNVGARLAEKRLDAGAYAALAAAARDAGHTPVLTFGPGERALAASTRDACPSALLAPETNLLELAAVMRGARAVLTCDTGPMHLAVAVGTPTCGIFVSTDPGRYGHADPPHLVIDARRNGPGSWLPAVRRWVGSA